MPNQSPLFNDLPRPQPTPPTLAAHKAQRQEAKTRERLAVHWRGVADRFRPHYPDSMVELALNRLQNGDVTATQYGVRVALRPDLGDNRAEADAYWPDAGCRCWSMKSRGLCSHTLAAEIFVEPPA
jgi:hypothetical protein